MTSMRKWSEANTTSCSIPSLPHRGNHSLIIHSWTHSDNTDYVWALDVPPTASYTWSVFLLMLGHKLFVYNKLLLWNGQQTDHHGKGEGHAWTKSTENRHTWMTSCDRHDIQLCHISQPSESVWFFYLCRLTNYMKISQA